MALNTLPGVHEMQSASIDGSKLYLLEDSVSKEDFLIWKSNMIDFFRQDVGMNEFIEGVENTALATNEDLEGIGATKAPLKNDAGKRSCMKNAGRLVYGWLSQVVGWSLFRRLPKTPHGDGRALWLVIKNVFDMRESMREHIKTQP